MQKPTYNQNAYLLNLVHRASEVVLKFRRAELKRYGLTPGGARTLRAVVLLGNKATRAEISRSLFREANSVTEIVKRLEKKGLVKTINMPGNRNGILVLTDKGQEVYQKVQETKGERLSRLLAGLSDKEKQELIAKLEVLTEKLFQQEGYNHLPPMLDLYL